MLRIEAFTLALALRNSSGTSLPSAERAVYVHMDLVAIASGSARNLCAELKAIEPAEWDREEID
ncbi:MAG: hypothetical protein JOY90_31830 [Bradyrhizobium sp.]|uniref:hypothetical protein n=1 Tax=Bradyrhizobium sp. TaxID=376 RepID=UPI001D795756|nr:hypothetical protein [Bradyrhizobium sp.]MBV9565003.1 hypothetical protein [Bradyrhizobium sp.]